VAAVGERVADAVSAVGGIADVKAALAVPMDGSTVDDVVKAAVAKVGENIQLKRVASIEVAGVTGGYVHGQGKLGVLVALETSASGEVVDAVAKDIAMHVAAHDPTPVSVDRDDMPKEIVDKEREFLSKQARESGKPEKVIEKMVEGRINKFFAESCLVEQGFVKDPDKKVSQVLEEAGKAAGGEIKVASFVRFKLGEAAAE